VCFRRRRHNRLESNNSPKPKNNSVIFALETPFSFIFTFAFYAVLLVDKITIA
jgi:hypothetical protein